jgi:hypothetical protein
MVCEKLMGRQQTLQLRRRNADRATLPLPVCDCGFPRVVHNNGCGHAPKCPVYAQWWELQQAALGFGRRR